MQTLLPLLFRWLARASPVRLPHRRHYTPTTEYSGGPPHTLRAVPSMIDLDLAVTEVADEAGGVTNGPDSGGNGGNRWYFDDGRSSCCGTARPRYAELLSKLHL